MDVTRKILVASFAALATSVTLAASGSQGVEHNTQALLDGLAKGGGQPLETLSPAPSCRRPT
jgi:hypothetical protein